MMGPKQTDQAALFYEFSLERHVPAAHMLRNIDRFVDLSVVRSELAPFYSSIGRPSIDPELLVRMLLVGYCCGIRSERRLCEEVHLNLAYRWFCRLGLDGEVPDHSTFSKNRHGRFRDCNLLRKLFETVVRRCMAEGLVDGTAFAVDASLIAADANKQRSAVGTEDHDWDALARARRSVREYLDTLDEAAWGAASETVPKFVSRSDPAAQWTGAHKGHAFFAYADNYLIDLKAAVIVDVEATRAIRPAEVGAARTMIARTKDRFGIHPERLAADSAYGSADMLGWLVDVVVDRRRVAMRDFATVAGHPTALVAAGGVAANGAIRRALTTQAGEAGLPFVAPPLALCGDNGAMIAWAGIERLRLGLVDDLTAPARARWPFAEPVAAA